MPSRQRRMPRALLAALSALTLLMAGAIWLSPAPVALLREAVLDAVIRHLPRPAPPVPVIVIDIGETDDTGLPWGRAATARLAAALAAAGPLAIGHDIVFSGDCGRGPVNDALAAALGGAPSLLGFLLADHAGLPPQPVPPMGVVGGDSGVWLAPGAEGACPALAAAAAGSVSLSLAGDRDGVLRRLPVAVQLADGAGPYPLLAVEMARRGTGAAVTLLGPGVLRLGAATVRLDDLGQMRLLPSPPAEWAARTIDAAEVLAGTADTGVLRGALVLVGSSLPKRGGLRATAASPLHPSVQVQADALRALLTGGVPHRPAGAAAAEALAVLAAGLAVLGLWRRGPGWLWPVPGAALVWVAAAAVLALWQGWLIDPLLPALAAVTLAALAVAGQAVASARAERALRARMSQLLPAAVVTRLAEAPDLLRVEGEARVVTALFTDIGGFTLTTRRLGPQALVRVLDDYFTLTTAIVLRHGGMIDKIVGDSLHVLFNAPLDQPGHVAAALACAEEIVAATDALRDSPAMREAALGRTRIGIETGPVVLGDVGAGGKIDYTAHGDAVNLAARLQDLNKDLGTQICIGPAAAAALMQSGADPRPALVPLGPVEIRSFGPLPLFTLPPRAAGG